MIGGSLRASSTTKTGRHDIAEILLKVALNTKIKSIQWNSYFPNLLEVSITNLCPKGNGL